MNVQNTIDFLLSLSKREDGVQSSLSLSDYNFLFDLDLDEDIVPDVLFRLKKYKELLLSAGLWTQEIENATKPLYASFKKRKPKPIEGCKVKQKGATLEISEISGYYWDFLKALKSHGGQAVKANNKIHWEINAGKLLEYRVEFEKLGFNLSIHGLKPASVNPKKLFTITRKRNRLHFFFPYSMELIGFFKLNKGFSYNKKDHSRSVTLNLDTANQVKSLIAEAVHLGFSVVGEENLHDLDSKVEEEKRERENAAIVRADLDLIKKDFDVNVPGLEQLKIQPYGYQNAGIAFLNRANGRGIIGDEMGLGKTLQALAWVVLNKKKAIVICPKSFIFGWQDEIKKFSEASVQVLGTKKVPLTGADFTIVNYESVEKHEFLDYDTVIIDESHFIKNKKAKRYLAVKGIAEKAEHVICLSGTAIVNRPVEFFTQLNLVKPGITGSFSKYTNRFCGAHHDGYTWNTNGASNLEGLFELIAPVYIRRNKVDVLKDLPEKIRQEIIILGIKIDDPEDLSSEGMLSWITNAKVNLANKKVHATIEFAKNMVDQGEKVIIFSDYIDPVVEIAKAFGDEAICYLASLTAEERAEAQRQFQEDPQKKVFAATSKIASVALTLTAASKVIFNDMPYSPGVLLQAEDRAHRNGQKNAVNVYRMIAQGTLDDKVSEILTRKAEILKIVLEGAQINLSAEDREAAQKSILTDVIDYFRVSGPVVKKIKAS